ncbi:hypothetical protein E8E12_011309 [Didymella heteroderae]|uniref:N-acetyltransferase domain-containing protein n=1 Tax=Didymella heteroderae TaxID=1769908 RepID=A0A9P4WZU8_9PLEO|nr:hypothetical protein E8E12_011309 [Didymella heteroderae]
MSIWMPYSQLMAHQKVAKIGSERMLQIFQGDPYGNFMKVVDDDTGTIAGAAKWNLYKSGEVPPQPAINGEHWDSEDDKEFAQALFHNFFALRQKVIQETNGNLVALEMMTVDPAYQCMGVGRLLVRWGLVKADELGVEAVVEGSERGRRLYASEGFDGSYFVVPVPEKFTARRKQVYYWMRRPAKKTGVTPLDDN